MVASIELTKCDLLSTKLVIPMECEGAYTPSDCTHALSRSPQLWNSYTGYLRDSFSLCQLVKPSGLANRQSIIVQHMDILLDRLNVAINTQESLNHHQYTQFNDLFNAIYIHLNHTTDHAINTLVAALDDLIDGSLNGIIDTFFSNLFSSIRSVVNLSILYYLLRWVYLLTISLFRLLKILIKIFKSRKPLKQHSPHKSHKLHYTRTPTTTSIPLNKRFFSAPP